MFSIVEFGGFQFKVSEGDIIKVPLIDAEKDAEITIDRILLKSDADTTVVGTPIVSGAKVTAKVLEHGRAPKILVMKKKRRKDYKKKTGHRQDFTKLQILSLG